ncbi:MAG: L-serine ammonia-lyase [Oligoflexia bacterium]|nr:L-serine ammonia-lyase [Oligoflexia bacterium]
MILSIFNLFNIGIGPSSSHTVGPMRAALFFIEKLKKYQHFSSVEKIQVELYGSLSLTGKGHNTDKAIIAGLSGEIPEETDPQNVTHTFNSVLDEKKINLNKERWISFDYNTDIIFNQNFLPYHPNGLIFYAYIGDQCVYKKTLYSIGGGFIVGHKSAVADKIKTATMIIPPYIFTTANELLSLCKEHNLKISDIALQNELALRTPPRIDQKIKLIWDTMKDCINRGETTEGTLPGRLNVKRRAKDFHQKLCSNPESSIKDPLRIIDWVNLYALSVNEENAAGGRVVTAPTNGAAGIIPAILMYYETFCNYRGFDDIKRFFLTAGTIGILYKINASISGAEVGCQGEVGVACSMAAAGLTELLGGTPEQIENAAEIAMEHNLGLTCDPVDGQVQIPCIERNAMGAVKAINAARIAMLGQGHHSVSLDSVMKTMKETGLDMKAKYKETSQGGLAVNITAC